MSKPETAGLHLRLPMAELGDEPARYHIQATPDELQALQQRFGVRQLAAMEADVSVARLNGGAALRIEGRIRADLTQDCVVTLEPVAQHIDESFRLDFAEPTDVVDMETGELVLSPDEDDPEPMPVGELDLGELLAEHLALAIDPYPRKPGVQLADVLQNGEIGVNQAKQNPFAVLSGLKDRK
jgi:uncharacterized metal-binding protein YceD (DUF177 family)